MLAAVCRSASVTRRCHETSSRMTTTVLVTTRTDRSSGWRLRLSSLETSQLLVTWFVVVHHSHKSVVYFVIRIAVKTYLNLTKHE